MMNEPHTVNDVIFDALAERFERKIYGSDKGELRLQLLWDDVITALPCLRDGSALTVLDAGGGLGQISQRMAALGHHVVLAEPAEAMLARAKTLWAEQSLDESNVEFVQASIQQLPQALGERQFDVLVCHAVLEWLAEPQATLQQLLRWLKPGGWLSLAFYNRESIVWKNLLKGNVNKVRSGKLAGDPGSLTPINPQSAPQVLGWLREHGMDILGVTGIRCLQDYLYPGVTLLPEDMLALERELSRQEPYKWLGRYIHVIARQSN